jgi:hypothetical protein
MPIVGTMRPKPTTTTTPPRKTMTPRRTRTRRTRRRPATSLQLSFTLVHEALGVYTHDVHRRWGSVFWRSWARVIRGRLPVIGRPNADILHHGPPPAYAHGREAVGEAQAWPQVHPGVVRGARAAAGL